MSSTFQHQSTVRCLCTEKTRWLCRSMAARTVGRTHGLTADLQVPSCFTSLRQYCMRDITKCLALCNPIISSFQTFQQMHRGNLRSQTAPIPITCSMAQQLLHHRFPRASGRARRPTQARHTIHPLTRCMRHPIPSFAASTSLLQTPFRRSRLL